MTLLVDDALTVGKVVPLNPNTGSPWYRREPTTNPYVDDVVVPFPVRTERGEADGYGNGWDEAKNYFTHTEVLYVLKDEYDYEVHHYGATVYADLEDLKRDHPDYAERGVLRIETRRVDVVKF